MKNYSTKAYAKVNLALDVISKRVDGYHEMRMINQAINLCDLLSFKLTEKKFEIKSSINMGDLHNNLIYKTFKYLKNEFNLKDNLRVDVDKNIPMEAGLAGGSANAAATIKAVNAIYELGLSKEQMCNCGIKIGADVPFCLTNRTALVEGIGEKITVLAPFDGFWILVVKPGIGIKTPWAFNAVDDYPGCIHPDIESILKVLQTKDYKKLRGCIGNTFENPVFNTYPSLRDIKEKLYEAGAVMATMSGSGSTIIGYFSHKQEADTAMACFVEKKYTCFVTKNIEDFIEGC